MKPVIVVEGISDIQRLENLIDADFVSCNGSSISEETINYIKELTKTRKVIILTDPDYPGKQIRNKIASAVDHVYHAFVDRNKSSNGKKLGVAECTTEEILRALQSYIYFDKDSTSNITMEDLYDLKLTGYSDSSKKRELISQKFSLGYVNSKTLLKRLNMLKITLEQLKEALK